MEGTAGASFVSGESFSSKWNPITTTGIAPPPEASMELELSSPILAIKGLVLKSSPREFPSILLDIAVQIYFSDFLIRMSLEIDTD